MVPIQRTPTYSIKSDIFQLFFYAESTTVKDDRFITDLETVEQSRTEKAESPFHNKPYRTRYT